MSIAENIARVREEIAAAAAEVGKKPEEITLVGASKMNDASLFLNFRSSARRPFRRTGHSP